jgi:glucosyl-3-phosphoglycerate synthase
MLYSEGMAFDLAGWFDRRTFHAADFSLADLAERQAAFGWTVSVVLPARNEEATISGVVESVLELVGAVVHEVVVIAAGTDATGERAAAAGARVHRQEDILPSHGEPYGKGDALWRSLAVTTGDIVVFVDADIRNPDPRFVWTLLGPLLMDPRILLVKGFYDRPIAAQDRLHPSGGGRVTELTARPLLNLFWPELAGLIQPLSGEYAARRTLLESIPFFTGYGVEIGMLIDVLRLHGPEVIAQVDLAERIHQNQSMEALSRMAFRIAQVAWRRLADEGRADGISDGARSYVQFSRLAGRMVPEWHEVQIVERPPMRMVRADV